MEEILVLNENSNLKEVSQVCDEYKLGIVKISSDVEKMALMSKAINLVKDRLDDNIIKHFKGLENTRLGFKTDKDNGYPISVVRTCLVEALIQGVKPIGNEFNIIGGNFYVTKEGFTGLMSRNPSFSELEIKQELPEYDHPNKRASVKYSASWKWNGGEKKTEGIVSIKLQYAKGSDYCVTSDDSIYGKAERKIRNRIWNMSTGENLIEGDISDLTHSERMERAKPVKQDPGELEKELGIKPEKVKETPQKKSEQEEWEDL